MCVIDGCKSSKTYNFIGLDALYCKEHKQEDMVNTRHEKCEDCNLQASFGYLEHNKRIKCSDHKLNGMVNLKHKNSKCIGYLCDSVRSQNLNNYCTFKCYISNTFKKNISNEINLDNKVSYKEYILFKHVNTFINQQSLLPIKPIVWDKVLCKGLCDYRPDFMILYNDFIILIELDEMQHKSYNKTNELTRIQNIHNTLNKPLFIIRFNPDMYYDGNNIIISPFKNNILVNETEWNNRLKQLDNKLNECINLTTKNNTYIISHLFYDKD